MHTRPIRSGEIEQIFHVRNTAILHRHHQIGLYLDKYENTVECLRWHRIGLLALNWDFPSVFEFWWAHFEALGKMCDDHCCVSFLSPCSQSSSEPHVAQPNRTKKPPFPFISCLGSGVISLTTVKPLISFHMLDIFLFFLMVFFSVSKYFLLCELFGSKTNISLLFFQFFCLLTCISLLHRELTLPFEIPMFFLSLDADYLCVSLNYISLSHPFTHILLVYVCFLRATFYR